MSEYIFFNWQLIESKHFKVSINDRAFNYGDGLFETMIYQNGKVMFLKDHLLRLKEGMNLLSMDPSTFPSEIEINNHVDEIIFRNQFDTQKKLKIKLTVWRKEGGLFLPNSNATNSLLRISEISNIANQHKNYVIKSPYKINQHMPFSKIKSLNSLPYILSANHAKSHSADDSIITNLDNNVVELTSSNIFFAKGENIYTPSLESGCLAGIMRKNIIKKLKDKFKISEKSIQFEQINDFDFCFASNVSGLYPIGQIDQIVFKDAKELINQIKNELSI